MARSALSIETRIEFPAWRREWPQARVEVRRFLSQAAQHPEINVAAKGAVAIVMTDDARVRRLNRQFRGKDQATNVLSFPDQSVPLGGIALAFETLRQESMEQHKQFVNHAKHMILHGFFHLLGFDHQTTRQARLMERLEIAILWEMGIPNPYVIETKTRA